MKIDLSRGDSIERSYLEWIRQHLPEYEELWSRFIGNDGTAQMLPIEGIGKISEGREEFSELNYSVLLAVLALKRISEKYANSLGEISNVESHIDAHSDLTSFMAHVGKMRDLFGKMDSALKLGGQIAERFDELYKQRSNIVHGGVPPCKIEEGMIKIPPIAGRVEGAVEWSDKRRWSSAHELRFNFLADFFSNTLIELLPLVRAAFAKCLNELERRLDRKLPVLTLNIHVAERNDNLSGQAAPGISGEQLSEQVFTTSDLR